MPHIPLLSGRPRAGSRTSDCCAAARPSRLKVAFVAAVSSLALGTTLVVAPGAEASNPILLGASGDLNDLRSHVGAPLAVHAFGKLNGSVPNGRLVNMKPNVPWSTVANAQPGSAVFSDIARWADTLNARPVRVLFTFSHEPESASSRWLGNNTGFVAAYRHVVTIFRHRGVDNVEFNWNMTAYAFYAPSRDPRYAPKWYPGDAYVDNVAADPYNWLNCGPGGGKWRSLGRIASPALAFAKSHGKQLLLAEFGSQRDPRRAQWLRDAYAWLKANRAYIRGAFYYNHPPTGAGSCYMKLTTAEEFSVFRAMASDPAFGA